MRRITLSTSECVVSAVHLRRFTLDPAVDKADVVDDKVKAAREALIDAIIQRDKEIFTLKRQHELSMLRVEQNQNRVLKDQQDRGIYYEQNCNVHTFDTISVGLYSQRSTLYHTISTHRLRMFKVAVTVFLTSLVWVYLYFKYMGNPEMMYSEKPIKLLGSKAHVIREMKAKLHEDEENKRYMEMWEKQSANAAAVSGSMQSSIAK